MIAWMSTYAAQTFALFLIGISLLLWLAWEVASTIAWGPRVRVRTVHRYAKASQDAWPPKQAKTTGTLTPLIEQQSNRPLEKRQPRPTPQWGNPEDTLSGDKLFASDVEGYVP